jgi:hypothetical protein
MLMGTEIAPLEEVEMNRSRRRRLLGKDCLKDVHF